jgi:hypothetical protein
VWAIDLASRRGVEQIGTSLYPNAPPGSTPNAVALSADGRTLLVANADNNTVAAVDVSRPGRSAPLGTIPTGWYPTGASFSRDGKRILLLSGKGLTSQANPRAPQPGDPGDAEYVAALLTGTLSVLDVPDAKGFADYTQTAHRLSAYADANRLAPERAPSDSAVPPRVGAPSPIKHVFYVVRENRTYDQILGDVKAGNGDAELCLFGENVTPNAHALAKEFVLFDNFYVDAEVSADGHAFSTAAYATDAIEKLWPQYYGRRDGKFLTEGGGPNRNAYGNITAPAQGYIWDHATRAGVSVRSYGEFAVAQTEAVDDRPGPGPYRGSVPGLLGRVAPEYPPYNLTIPDARRVDAWLAEFRRFEAEGNLPALSIIRLGNDHTAGTSPGFPTPTAMIAENDAALGRIVEAISKSRYWKESAVFVLEDDAQDGPDHVDAHRSVALVASPYARRGTVDSTLYTTSAMLRTIELILGIPPMSQYDAAARPMYAAFGAAADLRPFEAKPPRVSLDEKNDPEAWGAAASAAMDLDEADRAPDRELNEIVWRSVRGPGSPMPPPVHAAFVRPAAPTATPARKPTTRREAPQKSQAPRAISAATKGITQTSAVSASFSAISVESFAAAGAALRAGREPPPQEGDHREDLEEQDEGRRATSSPRRTRSEGRSPASSRGARTRGRGPSRGRAAPRSPRRCRPGGAARAPGSRKDRAAARGGGARARRWSRAPAPRRGRGARRARREGARGHLKRGRRRLVPFRFAGIAAPKPEVVYEGCVAGDAPAAVDASNGATSLRLWMKRGVNAARSFG